MFEEENKNREKCFAFMKELGDLLGGNFKERADKLLTDFEIGEMTGYALLCNMKKEEEPFILEAVKES
jgi:hypothetical protein